MAPALLAQMTITILPQHAAKIDLPLLSHIQQRNFVGLPTYAGNYSPFVSPTRTG